MSETKRRGISRAPAAGTAALLAGALTLTGCVHHPPGLYGEPSVPKAPQEAWTPPPKAVPPLPAAPAAAGSVPKDLLDRAQSLTLADVVDIALRNSPLTAESWAAARSAAADYGSQRGSYYPTVDVGGNLSRTEGTFANGAISYFQRSYAPTADLSWLLYDFGGREASIAEKRFALIAADYGHNAMIQNVILQVQDAYYQYVAYKALKSAQETSLKEAQTNLDAAQERHKAGLATIADVLQAKTNLAQAQLAFDSTEGAIQATRGALATAMGLPANVPYDVGTIREEDLNVDEAFEAVDAYLARAQAQRPDLAASRALAEKAASHVKTIKAEGYPALTGSATLGRTYYDNRSLFGNTYTAGIFLKVPIFTGFSHQYNVQKAKADQDAAEAQLQTLEQKVTLQVWTSYYDLKTARQRLDTTKDLLDSATQSHDVALGRYKAGVGSILDLLAAQNALSQARAQRIQAYADWFMALAQLAHDTGGLTTAGENQTLAAPVTVEKDGKP